MNNKIIINQQQIFDNKSLVVYQMSIQKTEMYKAKSRIAGAGAAKDLWVTFMIGETSQGV